ncbi:MAG: TetR family transcriptional regulator C-terminal domain-containing protein [Alphaproteobacteria bacterium]|nr:TetR family transcriptional regulator C-terminal domain-containing protein [Alphaproteobacteria bacterium]
MRRKPSGIAIERRQDLRDAAVRSIAKHGYAGVTVSMICEEAGFSRGLIGHYFKGKDDLLLEAIRAMSMDVARANQAAVRAAGKDPRDRLHAVVRSSFSPPGFSADQVAVWVALVGSARWSPSLRAIYRDLWRGYRAGISKLMRQAAEQRGIAIDAELAALSFSQLIEGFWVGWAADPVAVDRARAEKACHLLVDMLLSPAVGPQAGD